MSNIGPVGGDGFLKTVQNRLSPPLPKETSSVTTPDTISKPVINNDQFITAEDIGNSVVANLGLPPKNEKNSNVVYDAWSNYAVKPEAETADANVLSPINANAVLPPVLNAKPGAPINKLTESSPQETKLVIAEFMKLDGTTGTTATNASMIAATIIDGLAA
jgi:hypothetical protein